MLDKITYDDYRKKDDIHGTVLYPATMVAPIQKDILQELSKENKIESVFDPFHGTGTALYEAFEVSDKIQLFGCDINPLANLITKVKLEGVSDNIVSDIYKIKDYINGEQFVEIFEFPKRSKWFRNDIAEDLTKIRNAIMTINDRQNRNYFWYILCDVIRRYSNTQSSTYKLFIKPEEKIKRMENKVIRDYCKHVENNYFRFKKHCKNFRLYKQDIFEKIVEFEDGKFDVAITSPPYGDNATTVTYGQFSMLSLYWIDPSDLELEGWEMNNYSIIDNKSMGGNLRKTISDVVGYSLIEPYIKLICEQKRDKVYAFFEDYFIFLRELSRVTKQYIVMTLGNRTVNNVNINLTQITMQYLEQMGYQKVKIAQREILNKRTPKKTSRVNNVPVNSMSKEYVIIYERV